MRRNATIRIGPARTKINQSARRIVGTCLTLPSKSRTLLQRCKLSRELVLHPFEMQVAILRSRRRGEGSHKRRAKADWFLGCKPWPIFIAQGDAAVNLHRLCDQSQFWKWVVAPRIVGTAHEELESTTVTIIANKDSEIYRFP
jgi:hypothetical protein